MSALLTLQEVAATTKISLRTIQKLARAAEFAAEIRAGERAADDVPESLVPHLDTDFPLPFRAGAIRRIRQKDFDAWIG